MLGHTIAPVNLFPPRLSVCKLTNCPISTGIVPVICGKYKLNLDAFVVMYDGTYNTQLASDTIVEDVELFQIDQFAELLGQFSCKNVNISADTQRM